MYSRTKLGLKEVLALTIAVVIFILFIGIVFGEEQRYVYTNLTIEYRNGSINILNQSIAYFERPVKQVLGSNILYLLAEDRNTVLYKQYFLLMPFGIVGKIDPITKQRYEEFEYPEKIVTSIYTPYIEKAKYMLFTDIGGGNETILLLAPIERGLLKEQSVALEKPGKAGYWLLVVIALILFAVIWLFIKALKRKSVFTTK